MGHSRKSPIWTKAATATSLERFIPVKRRAFQVGKENNLHGAS
jgi:hypothetical protein